VSAATAREERADEHAGERAPVDTRPIEAASADRAPAAAARAALIAVAPLVAAVGGMARVLAAAAAGRPRTAAATRMYGPPGKSLP
jgi:hypothetical protein